MEYSEMLKEAIDASHIVPTKQKPVLHAICKQEYPIPASEIEDILALSRPSVNFSLQMLLKRNFIKRSKDGIFMYSANEERIGELLERYKNRIK